MLVGSLSHEHSTLFIGAQVRYSRADDPFVQTRIGRAWATSQLMLINGMRNVAKVQAGGQPGPEGRS